MLTRTRKDFLADTIIKTQPNIVGVYRLVMKSGSDNWRSEFYSGDNEADQGQRRRKLLFMNQNLLGTHFSIHMSNAGLAETFKSSADIIVANRTVDLCGIGKYCRESFHT